MDRGPVFVRGLPAGCRPAVLPGQRRFPGADPPGLHRDDGCRLSGAGDRRGGPPVPVAPKPLSGTRRGSSIFKRAFRPAEKIMPFFDMLRRVLHGTRLSFCLAMGGPTKIERKIYKKCTDPSCGTADFIVS